MLDNVSVDALFYKEAFRVRLNSELRCMGRYDWSIFEEAGAIVSSIV
jgi:hypothetical protein